ncbi:MULTISPECIES: 30S ribosomal protein S1 [Aerococcus]|uniref:30S ribosomal protein S1 n=2 Tax=Aerococcus TaxID=1375 RepID=A0A5N1GKW5_9LACT|nr:30S ribosomal protein S1 [Aerococcus sanguinicola]OFK21987.1 30S ribosomal protein S1 [Aerococcus sp. HMSC072A12]OFT43665.1 30S ribosomal protein S1 [Aerococcus sp. HMSC06H08]
MSNEFEAQNHEVEETEAMPSMEDVLDQTLDVKIGDTVNGEVLTIDENNQLIVGIEGAGVEGVVPFREISSTPIDNVEDVVKVGDVIELVVVKQIKEKENGSFLLSRRRVEAKKIWKELEEKAENDETITVPVKKVVKGGLVVDAGVRGFIPASMVEDHFVKDFTPYKDKELEVKIVEIDPAENRLILSHKEIAAEKAAAERAEKLAQFEAGQTVTGTVARLANFGAFIDLGGIDGLVHISQIAHHHVKHPSDVLTVGEEVDVKILSVDEERGRISLSIKDLVPGPWEDIEEKAPKGAVLDGVVRRLVDFGAFVEVFPGVEGLVHISQIAHEHVNTPSDKLSEGQEVQVKVLDVNPEENRLSLSIKALEEAPAKEENADRDNKPRAKKSRPARKNNRGQAVRQNQAAEEDTGFTFGDLLGDQLKGLDLSDED